jgi:hypothetical protein
MKPVAVPPLQGSGVDGGIADPGQRPGFRLRRDFPPALKGRDTARVSVWVSLTQAAGLGFVSPPLWGSPARTLTLSLTGFWSAAGWDRAGQLERNVR